MIYIKRKDELSEVLDLYLTFGEELPYFVSHRINNDTLLELVDVKTIKSGNNYLLIYPETASWCHVDNEEYQVCKSLNNEVNFLDLYSRVYDNATLYSPEDLIEFQTQLYRRGLLKINGKSGISKDIYNKSPLYHRAYLIELLITERCNLACKYCFAETSEDKEDMPTEIGYKAIDEAMKLPFDFFTLEFAGGEPFTRFDVFTDIVHYTEKKAQKSHKKVTIIVQSNGTLIDDEIAKFIKVHNIGVGISLDGPKYINDKTRCFHGGKSSYNKTLEGIKKLKEQNIKFGVLAVVHVYNYDKAEETMDHFISLGASQVRFNPILFLGRASLHWDDVGIKAEDYFIFMKNILNYYRDNELSVKEANLEKMIRNITVKTRDFRCMRSPCGGGYDYIVVDPKGDLYPCAQFNHVKELCMGNINDVNGSIGSCFMNNEITREMRSRTVNNIGQCKGCTWRHFCGGGCSLDPYIRHGTLYSNGPQCDYYKKMYPYLINYFVHNPKVLELFMPEALCINTKILCKTT